MSKKSLESIWLIGPLLVVFLGLLLPDASYAQCDNAITGGSFNDLSAWSAPAGYTVKTVSQGNLNGAVIRDSGGDQFALQQTIYSVKPSFLYELTFGYENYLNNCPSAMSKFKVEILADGVPLVITPWQFEATNNTSGGPPPLAVVQFTTPAVVNSLLIRISDGGSPKPACGAFITNMEIRSPLEVTTASTAAGCFGENRGSFTVEATGGAAPYTARYSTNGTDYFPLPLLSGKGEVTNLAAGDYIIAITDANNCTVTRTVNIAGATTALSVSATPVMCFGESTGTVTVSVTGGTPGYTFSLNGSSNNTGYFAGLSAGTYTVSVADQSGCTASTTFTISQPPSSLLASAGSTPASCFGQADGTIRVSASGGVSPYRYSLNGRTNTSGTFTDLPAGDYTVRVLDANNCEVYASATIGQPQPINPAAAVKNVTCFGGADGSIAVSASGGSGQYRFTVNGSTNATGLFTNLAAGSYSVQVQDLNSNCYASITVTVGEPAAELTAVATPSRCFGENTGSIRVIASGGTPGYTYSLNGATNHTGLFENMTAGTYTIDVEDARGCRTSTQATILNPSAPLTLAASVFNNNCKGGSNGSITAVAAGGATEGYTYTLSGSSNTTGTFTSLPAGTYTVIVTDANGCSTSLQATVLEPATALTASAISTAVTCYGEADGSIQVTAAGGTVGYTFTLNNVTNATGTFNGLAAGTYSITVTDGIGCSVTTSVTVPQPAELMASVQPSWCYGQPTASISVSATGGTPGYRYTLNSTTNTSGTFTGVTSGTHVIEVTDARGCTTTTQVNLVPPPDVLALTVTNKKDVSCFGESSGRVILAASGGVPPYLYTVNDSTSTSGVFANLASGTYTVFVTDANGCRTSIPVQILEASTAIQAVVSATAATCVGEANGSLRVSATGGTGGYAYTLNGRTNSTGIFTEMPAGTYTILVSDRTNCTVSVTGTISEPGSTLTVTARPEKCSTANGTIYLTATGGTPGYTYHLNGSSNTTGVFTNVPNGTYQFLITDAKNCSETVRVTLTEPATPLSAVVVARNDISCFGSAWGSVEVKATGGIAPYTYTVMNGPSNSTGLFTDLKAGSYVILITDRNGCTIQENVTINELSSSRITATATVTPVNCSDESTGAVQVTATGGTAPHRFTMNGVSNTTGHFTNLPSGTYLIDISDALGCTVSVSAVIDKVAPVEATVAATDVSCFGEANGTLTIRASGGTGNFRYSVNGDTNTTGVFTGLPAGSYAINVTDENGCSKTVQGTIRQPAALTGGATTTPATASDAKNGSATVTVRGGTVAYTYSLNGVTQSNGQFMNLSPGAYTVEVTDAQGCRLTVPFVIEALNRVDLTPVLTITPEGKKVSITAQLREPFKEDVLVTLGFSGSASGKQDYLLTDQFQTIKIPQGSVSTSEKVTIHALSDAIAESDEDLQINITSTSNPLVQIGESAVVIIQDVDPDDPLIDRNVPENKDLFPEPLISPNDDGEGNEFFNIGNILSFPENEVVIYNRWGNVVFKVSGYNGTDKVFRGVANTGTFANAPQPLVDGVYYYVIYTYKTVDGVRQRRLNKGYLILKR